jgi:hypothetical protein
MWGPKKSAARFYKFSQRLLLRDIVIRQFGRISGTAEGAPEISYPKTLAPAFAGSAFLKARRAVGSASKKSHPCEVYQTRERLANNGDYRAFAFSSDARRNGRHVCGPGRRIRAGLACPGVRRTPRKGLGSPRSPYHDGMQVAPSGRDANAAGFTTWRGRIASKMSAKMLKDTTAARRPSFTGW